MSKDFNELMQGLDEVAIFLEGGNLGLKVHVAKEPWEHLSDPQGAPGA